MRAYFDLVWVSFQNMGEVPLCGTEVPLFECLYPLLDLDLDFRICLLSQRCCRHQQPRTNHQAALGDHNAEFYNNRSRRHRGGSSEMAREFPAPLCQSLPQALTLLDLRWEGQE